MPWPSCGCELVDGGSVGEDAQVHHLVQGLGGIADDVEGPVGPNIADPQRGELGQAEAGVEEDERQRPLPLVGEGEEAPQLRVGEGGNEPVGDLRAAQPSKATRRSGLVGMGGGRAALMASD